MEVAVIDMVNTWTLLLLGPAFVFLSILPSKIVVSAILDQFFLFKHLGHLFKGGMDEVLLNQQHCAWKSVRSLARLYTWFIPNTAVFGPTKLIETTIASTTARRMKKEDF